MGKSNLLKRAKAFHYWLWLTHRRKRFFVTEKGFMGTGTGAVETGDRIVLFMGLKTPFVLRPAGGAGSTDWRLIGPVYIEGLMEGEGWEDGLGVEEIFII
jgi:hypothetical protein